MRVGILRADLMIHGAHSLKEKRKVLKSLKDRLSSRFNVAVAEVGSQDLWQRAEIGLAVVSNDARHADAQLQKLEDFIEAHPGASVLSLTKDIFEGEPHPGHFEPEEWEKY